MTTFTPNREDLERFLLKSYDSRTSFLSSRPGCKRLTFKSKNGGNVQAWNIICQASILSWYGVITCCMKVKTRCSLIEQWITFTFNNKIYLRKWMLLLWNSMEGVFPQSVCWSNRMMTNLQTKWDYCNTRRGLFLTLSHVAILVQNQIKIALLLSQFLILLICLSVHLSIRSKDQL